MKIIPKFILIKIIIIKKNHINKICIIRKNKIQTSTRIQEYNGRN